MIILWDKVNIPARKARNKTALRMEGQFYSMEVNYFLVGTYPSAPAQPQMESPLVR